MSKDVQSISGKLTKKFFAKLRENAHIVVVKERGIPVYDDEVAQLSKRDVQWEKIVKASVDQELCHVFDNKADYKKWLKLMFDK